MPSRPDEEEPTEVSREARLENLPALLRAVACACARGGVDPGDEGELRLAVEEVCVNVIKHGYAGRAPGPIRVACAVGPDRVRVTVTDEAPPFDPASAPRPDLGAGWEDRPVGGLGWHLVRESVDEVRHEVTERGGNRLTLIKNRRRSRPLAVS